MPKSVNTSYKAAFRQQMHASIALSMTTYCAAYVLNMDQWHTAHAWCYCRIVPASNGQQRESDYNRWHWKCQECKLTTLHKVKRGRRRNDVENEHIGTHRTRVSQQAEQVTTRHSRCNDTDIGCIGTSHAPVCQQAEKVNEVTGLRATRKDD